MTEFFLRAGKPEITNSNKHQHETLKRIIDTPDVDTSEGTTLDYNREMSTTVAAFLTQTKLRDAAAGLKENPY